MSLPGDVIDGRYRIVKQLGEGGMSTVFLAEHWLIKRRVAVKIMHREYASDADMMRRFMNEALAAGTLGHPHIVESTDMGFARGDVPYIVYEYIEGTLLSEEIQRVADFSARRAMRIAHQIASALEAAHNAGIVHRDLKSENIFLTERAGVADHVKVLDFGISRFLAATDRTGVNATVMGTPEFMAPEQVLSPESVDKRADIYALGVVLYEMLAGRPPFALRARAARDGRADVEAMHRLLDRIIQEPAPPLMRPDAPPGLTELVTTKLLAKDPRERLQSMRDVQAALETFGRAIVDPTGPIPTPLPMVQTGPVITPAPPPRRKPASSAPPPHEAAELGSLSDQTLSRSLLDPQVLAREVKQLGKRWSLAGTNLVLKLASRSILKLAAVSSQVATIADEMEHRPSLALERGHQLEIVIHAYDERAITVLDLVFAARIEQWLRDQGW